MDATPVAPVEFATATGLDDWRFHLGAIHAEFLLGSFSVAAGLIASIGVAADEADHHPEMAIRYPGTVRVALTTHDAGGVTRLDLGLARTISRLATETGAIARPLATQSLELAIDTVDAGRIRPFWAAVLNYVDGPAGTLVDPSGRGPSVWFQQLDVPRPVRNRIHVDVSLPHDAAPARLAAALAAGGRLVSDEWARSWWVLADVDGNEACLCTWQDR